VIGCSYSKFEYLTTEPTLCGVKRRRLAAVLRQIRLEAGLTQAQVAKKIGQTQSYVSKYEGGEQRLDLAELEAICRAADVSLRDVVDRYLEAK
jgi:transcriptional regulator with XRE-family HTH domain